ncbi:uncharacterized protein LOC121873051 [Homarus americanus]|uniref:uncharacterized protein LOC121873051 n=1 Tax=Homarus americanus TaxID=6706 RepID=UPI001C473224|nr:uncharacterized protein LOC121873051 [Homarus americanus]
MRLRQEPIALMADIEAMFHQVKVNPEHRDALRFLWWEGGDLTQTPMTYAANRAKSNFYEDYVLLSVTEPKEAIIISRQLRHLLSLEGFKLTKWISNDKEVLNTIPFESRHAGVKEVNLGCEDLPTERALGVMWDLNGDQFAAKVQVPTRPASKKGLRAVVRSVYDPLGFICPFTIKAKLIFQDESRRKKNWDEDITKQNLHKPGGLGCATSSHLHHFCDAAQVAYVVVTYLLLVDNEGNARCSFVCGKGRLAPLKQLMVPRLELCAAVMATRADQTIKSEIGVPLEESVFWTDSMSVVKYIANLEKRLHTLVANRISAIHEVTEKAQ